MKSIFIIAAILLLSLSACTPRQVSMRYVCDCEQNKRVQEFVKSTTADANNKSDEEMEDVIEELYKVGVWTNCRQTQIAYDDGRYVLITPGGEIPVPDSLTVTRY